MHPTALWLDGTEATTQADLRGGCSPFFRVVSLRMDAAGAEAAIREHAPALLVFEFDRPDRAGLRLLQVLKRRHPSVPILMLTLESSEALAVWAFRSRVWNYLVKPIDLREFTDNVQTLRATVDARSVRTHAVLGAQPQVPNLPGPRTDADHAGLGPAIAALRDRTRGRRSAAELAALCGLSRFEFSRRFRRAFGTSFQEYVQRARIGEACRLLRAHGTSVTDVAFAVGFNDSSHFAQTFKRYVGVLPSAYACAQRHAAASAEDAAPLLELG